MKNILFSLFFLSVIGCGSAKQKPLPADTEITLENAKKVTAFENTPESIVMFFYASMIRKDNAWEKVCMPAGYRSDDFKSSMDEYSRWKFNKYRFVEKEEFKKDKWWVTIYMEIEFEGETDDGEDEVQVELVDGKYLITEIPT